MGVFCGFEEFSDLEKKMHESTGILALLVLWTMTNVCLWHSQRWCNTDIYIYARLFGGTRIANNSVLNSAGITHLPVPSASMRDPSMALKLRSDV